MNEQDFYGKGHFSIHPGIEHRDGITEGMIN